MAPEPIITINLDYWSPTPSSVAAGLYGGDVTAWHWQQGSNTQMTYVLSYDSTGRLTDSRTVSGNGTTASASWSERNMTYDRNGNLKTLSRYGSSSSSPTQSLSYTYTGNRRSGYSYDSDGRVTTDDAGGVTRTYGILGYPYQTKTGNTVNAQYTYLSDGTRTKAVDSSGSVMPTEAVLCTMSAEMVKRLRALHLAAVVSRRTARDMKWLTISRTTWVA